MRRALLLSIGVLAACGPGAPPPSDNSLGADLVLTGGKIFTVDDDNPWAEAVAIEGDRIIYVGDDASASAFISKSTQTSDLGGRLVIPGIIDSHSHPGLADIDPPYGPIPETSHEDILAAVREFAEANPQLEWIHMCCFPLRLYGDGRVGPHKRDLDAIVPDRPVWITSDVTHSAWLNSNAWSDA